LAPNQVTAGIVVDCTELFSNPINTGIQRVVRALLGQWPSDRFATPIVTCLRQGRMARVPSDAVDYVLSPIAQSIDLEASRRRVQELLSGVVEAAPLQGLQFVPEVTFDHSRCAFLDTRLAAGLPLAMLAYDFLPYLRPELFSLRTNSDLMDYLRVIRRATHVAHISDNTRDEFLTRICGRARADEGPVLPLGTDGIQCERQAWHPSRRGYVAVGSIDGRKNQQLIFRAFAPLWRAGIEAPLTLIGRPFASADLGWIEEARSFPQFKWLDNASDADVAAEMKIARCSLYVSDAEGYGLPPVESLGLGVPAIVSSRIPSVRMLETDAMVRLETVSAESIGSAVRRTLDDEEMSKLWNEASALQLPTWADFALSTAGWLASLTGESERRASATASAGHAAAQ
jgi:glycosyltransferase involved in cell wall biosynthesis